MSIWAAPGVKCVCLRVEPWIDAILDRPTGCGPVTDEVCTISLVLTDPQHGVGLVLEGHRDPRGGFAVFPIQYFRPLVSEPDDVALFAHHLDRVGEPA